MFDFNAGAEKREGLLELPEGVPDIDGRRREARGNLLFNEVTFVQSDVIEQLPERIRANHIYVVVIEDSFVATRNFLTWFHLNLKWMQPLRTKFLHVSIS